MKIKLTLMSMLMFVYSVTLCASVMESVAEEYGAFPAAVKAASSMPKLVNSQSYSWVIKQVKSGANVRILLISLNGVSDAEDLSTAIIKVISERGNNVECRFYVDYIKIQNESTWECVSVQVTPKS